MRNLENDVFGNPEQQPDPSTLPTDEELDAGEADVFQPDESHQRAEAPEVPQELYMKPGDDIQGGGPRQS